MHWWRVGSRRGGPAPARALAPAGHPKEGLGCPPRMSFGRYETRGKKRDPSDHYWVETVEKVRKDIRMDSREPKAAGASSMGPLGLPGHAARQPLGGFSRGNERSGANPRPLHDGVELAGDRPSDSRPQAPPQSTPPQPSGTSSRGNRRSHSKRRPTYLQSVSSRRPRRCTPANTFVPAGNPGRDTPVTAPRPRARCFTVRSLPD